MILVNTAHTPHSLINSPLVGLENKVELYYSVAFETLKTNQKNFEDYIDEFLKNTKMVADFDSVLKSSLVKISPLCDMVKDAGEKINTSKILRDEIKKEDNIRLTMLTHDTKITTMQLEIKMTALVKDLTDVDPSALNVFYTIVKTEVANLQSDPSD